MTFAEYYMPWLAVAFFIFLFIDRGLNILAEVRTATVIAGLFTLTTASAILMARLN